MKATWIIFGTLFILFCLPFLEKQFHFINPDKLNGVEFEPEKDTLTLEAWMDGRFQKKEERLINEKIGLSEIFIRIYNQFNFSCFRITQNSGVVIGKKDFLYLTSYTDNFSGKNFIGGVRAQATAKLLKILQDTLKKKNIDLIIALGPGKASFYSEYVPDTILPKIKSLNNYAAYRYFLQNENVNLIDFHSWFMKMKGHTPYKLYPKYGAHWSYYGTYLAGDSLKKFIETIHNCRLPEIRVNGIKVSDKLIQPDYDIGDLLNIYSTLKDTMPYPDLVYGDVGNLQRPKLLVISDSYAWQWNEQEYFQHMSGDWAFWFYNNTMYPESFKKTKTTADINYCETLLQKEVIVVLTAEGTYDLFPYFILDKTEPLIMPSDEAGLIEYYKLKIKSNKEWFIDIVKKAIKEQTTVEQMVVRNAEWMAKQQLEKKAQ